MMIERLVEFAAELGDVTEFGTLTLKSGQVAKFGKHLNPNLKSGTLVSKRGVYSITDPKTKGVNVIRRGTEEAPEANWRKSKNVSIEHLDLPKKHRGTLAGGRTLADFNAALLPHLDKRKLVARTYASSYEAATPQAQEAGTLALTNKYARVGFKISDKSPVLTMPWGVPMKRNPGAAGTRNAITQQQIDAHVRERGRTARAKAIRSFVGGTLPTSAQIATGGVAAAPALSNPEDTGKSHPGRLAIAGVGLGVAGHGLAQHKQIVKGITDATDALRHNYIQATAALTRSKNKHAAALGEKLWMRI